ncbi:MAG: glycosyltransferase family 4 protein, partial [Campylobacterales bacterium]|nr:glycosyltransferase family 4 protein [Campylobacterales bacterium]
YDVVIIEYLQYSYVLPLFPKALKILDTHDLMHVRNQLFKANNRTHWIDISESEELSIFREYNHVLSIQKKEHDYCIKNSIPSILTPYSYEGLKCDINKNMKDIIFVGGNNEANIDAICWFIDEVWPLFAKTPLNLVICGTVCSGLKYKYKELPSNVFLKGLVKDLSLEYKNASVAINPVRLGGGLKIKNVEALANSLPLITTKEGSNGLEDGINSAFIVADTVDDWINGVISLWISKELRGLLSNNAYKYAHNNFSEKACYSQLVNIISEHVKND